MAKRFAGFTPEQLGRIDPSLAGKQSDEQQAIIAANPALAARLGKMSQAAQKRVEMAYGGYVKGFAEGGVAEETPVEPATSTATFTPGQLDQQQQALADAQAKLQDLIARQAASPEDASLAEGVNKAQADVTRAQTQLQQAQAAFSTTQLPSGAEATQDLLQGTGVATQEVATTTPEQQAAGQVATDVGQITTPAGQVTPTLAETAAPITTPAPTVAQTFTPLEASADTAAILSRLTAATGKPSDEALADAAQMSPQDLAQLGLSPAQIQQAQQVQAPEARTVQEGELISGSAVDMARVEEAVNFEAATGAPSSAGTVQGQLTKLMSDFEGKNPPSWAAGAMRAAAAQMAARGLTGSSMAGQAIVQAAMESALPIASQDAQTVAQFELQNLSNKQQTAMFAAQQRAEFLGLEFNQDFQARVANAAKISEIANINFTADQQVALENARMAQSVDLANLNAQNAKILADAAAMSQLDMANLNNRQQAAVQNAQSFLQMDMQNLSNAQQTSVFKTQQLTSALLTDVAAENASRQFNATSQSQNDQFFANLTTQIARFNNEQINSMNEFNTNQANTVATFNVSQKDQREQFNAENALIIAQANALWAQKYTTADNAAINQANRDRVMAENDFTMAGYNNILQRERDAISYAFKATDSQMERDLRLTLQEMQMEIDRESLQAELDSARGSGFGSILAAVAPSAFEWATSGFKIG